MRCWVCGATADGVCRFCGRGICKTHARTQAFLFAAWPTAAGLRALAIGRKNHYGSRSERGTRVAALFYTLIESAKLAGVEPAAYLAEATRRAIANPGTVTLPRDLVPS